MVVALLLITVVGYGLQPLVAEDKGHGGAAMRDRTLGGFGQPGFGRSFAIIHG